MRRRFPLLAALLSTWLVAGRASAQPTPPAPPAPAPPAPAGALDFDDPHIDEEMLEAITGKEGGDLTLDVLAQVLQPVPDGLTPEDAAKRATDTSPSVAAARAELDAAAARVDRAFAAYFPTARVIASYTRVSEVDTEFDIGLPGPAFELPQVLNQWSLVAALEVPISDYLLRLTQGYAAVSKDVTARELLVEARKLQIIADAKVAYFNWVRARGRAVVSGLAVALSKRHLEDAELTLAAELISRADVARLEAQLAQSRYLLVQSLAFEKVAAMQLRRVLHAEDTQRLDIGVDVLGPPPPPVAQKLPELLALARRNRLDMQALDRTQESLEEAASATRASYYPRLDAFANATYANPNPRIFPQENRFDLTWDVGVRLTWVINDTFTTIGAAAEADARVASVAAEKRALEDAVAVEVTRAYYDIETARAAITAAEKREESAKISLDTRRQLFRAGQATATEIVDAEAELVEAGLQRLDAHVDILVARARLEHAIGAKID